MILKKTAEILTNKYIIQLLLNLIINEAPPYSLLDATICAPNVFNILLTIYKPSPIPALSMSPEKNGSNILFICSSLIPRALSIISITILSFVEYVFIIIFL